jgi:SNF2 family DNA or RNA helicase
MKALKAEMHIACTGTPVENRLLDLWNICDALQPGLLSSAREFVQRFEKRQGGGNQESSLLELKKVLLFQQPHAFLLRRTKSDVAKLPPKSVFPLYCDMSEAEIAAHRSLLKNLMSDSRQSRFLSALQGFVQLYQHPAMLTENAEDLSVSDLVSQSSKLRVLLAKLHEIRGRREKVIVFARLRTMQGILAKVLQAEFQLPVRIINGETKLRAAGS